MLLLSHNKCAAMEDVSSRQDTVAFRKSWQQETNKHETLLVHPTFDVISIYVPR